MFPRLRCNRPNLPELPNLKAIPPQNSVRGQISRADGRGSPSRRRDVVFTIAWMAILFSVLLLYIHHVLFVQLPQRGQRKLSLLEGRFGAEFPRPDSKAFLHGSFQKIMEQAASDQFPYREPMLSAYAEFLRKLYSGVLDLVGSRTSPLLPAGGDIMIPRDGQQLLDPPKLRDSRLAGIVEQRAHFYNGLAARHTNTSFYVLAVPHASDSIGWQKVYPPAITEVLAGETYCHILATNVAPNIKIHWVNVNSSPEQMDGYYKTDHHWNMAGAYRAYLQLHALLSDKDSALGPPVQASRWLTLDGVQFRGTLARRAMFSGLRDELVDGDFQLPPLAIEIDGNPCAERGNKRAYQRGQAPTGFFYAHYAGYFGGDHGLIHYRCQSNPTHKLLVVSDSNDNSIEPLLASHYADTYFLDPRFFGRNGTPQFDLEGFVERESINQVVFLGGQDWILGLVDNPD